MSPELGVSGKADACPRSVAHVSEDHLDDIDSRSLDALDFLDPAVGHCLVGHPGTEDGVDGAEKLLAGILGEIGLDVLAVDRLEFADEDGEFLSVDVGVEDFVLGGDLEAGRG